MNNWKESKCGCGMGADHSFFIRSDMAQVSFDHGALGSTLTDGIYATGSWLGDEIRGCKTFAQAMAAIDKKWPL